MFIFGLAKRKLDLAEELILIADGYRESPFSSGMWPLVGVHSPANGHTHSHTQAGVTGLNG